MWVIFNNGEWYLFNQSNGETILHGKLKAGSKEFNIPITSAVSFAKENIAFANKSAERLEVLNPIKNIWDDGWELELPTMQNVPKNDRND